MHQTLQRQVKRTLGSSEGLPEKILQLLKLVSDTYDHFDEDRALMDRSMEISSLELTEKNKQLNQELGNLKTSGIKISELEEAKIALKFKADELEKLNQIMLDRESRVLELKNEIKSLREQLAANSA